MGWGVFDGLGVRNETRDPHSSLPSTTHAHSPYLSTISTNHSTNTPLPHQTHPLFRTLSTVSPGRKILRMRAVIPSVSTSSSGSSTSASASSLCYVVWWCGWVGHRVVSRTNGWRAKNKVPTAFTHECTNVTDNRAHIHTPSATRLYTHT